MGIMTKVGVWAFLVGVVLALISGLGGLMTTLGLGKILVPTLVLVGLIVGFLNVTDKETTPFLMASVSMMIALFTAGIALDAMMASLGSVGQYILDVLRSINLFVFPATIVVAMKAIWAMAKDE